MYEICHIREDWQFLGNWDKGSIRSVRGSSPHYNEIDNTWCNTGKAFPSLVPDVRVEFLEMSECKITLLRMIKALYFCGSFSDIFELSDVFKLKGDSDNTLNHGILG